jgi:hypothetical protein
MESKGVKGSSQKKKKIADKRFAKDYLLKG